MPSETDVSKIVVGELHDSVRPSKVVWADSSHLITCGFSRSAFREIALHRISGEACQTIALTNIDVSPAPLFPHYDQDTGILFVYAKGERICHAYEIQLESVDKSKVFTKLPSFEHGALQSSFAFLPKQNVDVKSVEIAKAFRLTPTSIQTVSFTVPRAKMEFFQDDIFQPTVQKWKATALSPQDWLQGQNAQPELVDLQPSGMPLRKSHSDSRSRGHHLMS